MSDLTPQQIVRNLSSLTGELDRLPSRLRSRISVAESGCWEWSGSTNSSGYGTATLGGRSTMAHRLTYEILRRPIPTGLHIDHLCRNRRCVNPDHLEPVVPRVNVVERSDSFAGINARKTHCPQRHPYDSANTYMTPAGRRHCRTCHRIRQAARRSR